jgi:hypothetical protein
MPGGADALLQKLPQNTGGDFLGNLMSSVTGGAGGTSADLVNNLLGAGANAIGGTLSKSLGFDVRPMISMATPIVAGLITKMISEGHVNSSNLASTLKNESDSYLSNPANRDVSGLVSQALDAGDKATALRNTFSDDEWMKVRLAPVAALYLIGIASPSAPSGAAKELAAAVGAVTESVNAAAPTSLIGAAFGGGLTKAELDKLHQDDLPRERVLGVIRDGLALVSQKSPADAQSYRDMVMNVAQSSAEAAKEGGFLGIGGTMVSREEDVALNDIRAALGA